MLRPPGKVLLAPAGMMCDVVFFFLVFLATVTQGLLGGGGPGAEGVGGGRGVAGPAGTRGVAGGAGGAGVITSTTSASDVT